MAADSQPKQRGEMPIGHTLEMARKRAGYSEAGAARALDISEYDLGRFESGIRTPSESMIEEFAAVYETDLAGVSGFDGTTLSLGWADIDLAEALDNEAKLRRISTTIRSIRRIGTETAVVVRTDEHALIAEVLDTTDSGLVDQLAHWFSLDPADAQALAAALRAAQPADD